MSGYQWFLAVIADYAEFSDEDNYNSLKQYFDFTIDGDAIDFKIETVMILAWMEEMFDLMNPNVNKVFRDTYLDFANIPLADIDKIKYALEDVMQGCLDNADYKLLNLVREENSGDMA